MRYKYAGTRNFVKFVYNRYVFVLATCFTLVSYLFYSSTLKMEATCSSKSSVDFRRTTRRCIPEGRNFHITAVRIVNFGIFLTNGDVSP
jgi:hypothetical protein